jgi:hypothetical protein
VNVEDQQRHGNGKNTVAESGEPLQVLTRDAVIPSGHGESLRTENGSRAAAKPGELCDQFVCEIGGQVGLDANKLLVFGN